MEKAIFAAGCFWGVEDAFRKLKGVKRVTSGYTGGTEKDPSYERVCSGATGHAEAVEVEFDPSVVSYETLLQTFWKLHDPTQVNRQGPDVGTQYRSAIFTTSDAQQQAALASRRVLESSGRFSRPLATVISPASVFYKAEEYHQQYLVKQQQLRTG